MTSTRSKSKATLSDQNIEESADSSCSESTPKRQSTVKRRRGPLLRKRAKKPIKKDNQADQEVALENFPDVKPTAEDSIDAEAEKYFAYGRVNVFPSKDKKTPKRNTTVSKQSVPQLSLDLLRECFENDGVLVADTKQKLSDSFNQWMLYLSQGFNLLLHGFGSKLDLLEEFRHSHLVENGYTHLVVHGFRPEVSVKQLLNSLQTGLKLELSEKWKTGRQGLVQRAIQICQALETANSVDFVILIHNIDGLALRNEECQTALSHLAESQHCRIIASIDHVNAPLLWDRRKLNRFRWVNIDGTTYANYRREIDGHGSKLLGLTKKGNSSDSCHSLNGLKSIWSSLNKNSQAVFTKLAKSQLTKRKGGGRGSNLMTFTELFDSCREDYVISSEVALKQMLVEFEDHDLLKTKLNSDEEEVLYLNIGKDLLKEFLESQNIEMVVDEVENTSAMDNTENDSGNAGKDEDDDSGESDDAIENDYDSDDALQDMSF